MNSPEPKDSSIRQNASVIQMLHCSHGMPNHDHFQKARGSRANTDLPRIAQVLLLQRALHPGRGHRIPKSERHSSFQMWMWSASGFSRAQPAVWMPSLPSHDRMGRRKAEAETTSPRLTLQDSRLKGDRCRDKQSKRTTIADKASLILIQTRESKWTRKKRRRNHWDPV